MTQECHRFSSSEGLFAVWNVCREKPPCLCFSTWECIECRGLFFPDSAPCDPHLGIRFMLALAVSGSCCLGTTVAPWEENEHLRKEDSAFRNVSIEEKESGKQPSARKKVALGSPFPSPALIWRYFTVDFRRGDRFIPSCLKCLEQKPMGTCKSTPGREISCVLSQNSQSLLQNKHISCAGGKSLALFPSSF